MRLLHLFPILPLAAALPSLQPRQGTNWPACQTSLSCTYWDIESGSMQSRLSYVQYMEATHFPPLNSSDRFRNIEGVIEFFISKSLGAPGSWISLVDAGIVQAIQSGAASTLGYPAPPASAPPAANNPGIPLWADYFAHQRQPGGYPTRETHDYAWGESEATATEWAKASVADVVAVPPATTKELNWYQFSVLYRWIMRHEDLTVLLLTPIFLTESHNFVFWLTDVTRSEPALCGSQAAWAVAGTLSFDLTDVVQLPTDAVDLLKAIYDCGKDYFENS